MDKPISVGDLVQVVKSSPCCGNTIFLGVTFTVTGMAMSSHCTHCKSRKEAVAVRGKSDGRLTDIRRLKRIPPLSELEGQHTQETTRNPVHNYERHFKVKA